MFPCPLRPSLGPIAIYAIMCVCWVGFVYWLAPDIVAYSELNPSTLDFVAAALLAALLHFVIVLFIYRIDRKHRDVLKPARPYSDVNAALVVFSAAFLALTVLSGIHGDYQGYLHMWTAVLAGRDPWESGASVDWWVNNYGPLFNALAPLTWINPFMNKLLFAFSYLVYVIWLIKVLAPRRGCVALSWPWVGLWLLNPFPWEQIAYLGYFDILVSLACVAAVHSLVNSKDSGSGTYLALGILLKYMPIVILPFLVFSKRRFHFRALISCAGVVFLGLVVSVLIWGTSTFSPLTVAVTRESILSIYIVLPSTHSPLRPFLPSLNVDWLDKPFLLTAGLGTFTWCIFRKIEPALSSALAILVTLLFYRVGYANYQMVFFSLILYWSVFNWAQFKEHFVLAALLIAYFCFLTIQNLYFPWGLIGNIFYSKIIIALVQFLLGCTLLICLAQLRPEQRESGDTQTG